jgi:dTDP-4-amino-4,6-dideoxy-D-galactose acyltransferase
MILKHHTKAWDSEFFGFKVGEAFFSLFDSYEYEFVMKQFQESGYRLVYIFPLDEKSFKALQECHLTHIDTKTTFGKELDNNFICEKNEFITKYIADDRYEELASLALTSGIYSRFKKDTNFLTGTFESLYNTWITKSISHEIADEVLVYSSDKIVEGFVTYSQLNELKVIGLIAVSSNSINKGIGKSLMKAVENAAYKDGCNKVNVSTQSENLGACRFYTACGYQIIQKQPVFHLWI